MGGELSWEKTGSKDEVKRCEARESERLSIMNEKAKMIIGVILKRKMVNQCWSLGAVRGSDRSIEYDGVTGGLIESLSVPRVGGNVMVWESWKLGLWSQSWERNGSADCGPLLVLSECPFLYPWVTGALGVIVRGVPTQCPACAVGAGVGGERWGWVSSGDPESPWGEPHRALTCLSVPSWKSTGTPRSRWSSCRRSRVSWCRRRTTCAASIARPSWPAASSRAYAASCSATTVPSR